MGLEKEVRLGTPSLVSPYLSSQNPGRDTGGVERRRKEKRFKILHVGKVRKNNNYINKQVYGHGVDVSGTLRFLIEEKKGYDKISCPKQY